MRDFAKKTQMTDVKRTRKNKEHNNFNVPSSFSLRKIVLALLLLVLVIAFVISFYSRNKLPHQEILTSQTVNILSKVDAKANNTQDKNISTQETSKVITKNNKPLTQAIKASIIALPTTSNSTTNTDPKTKKEAIDKTTNNQLLTFAFYNTLTNKTIHVDANPNKSKQYHYTYMLQVGSYRNQSDANVTLAQLILAGLKPAIQKVGNWYRLDVGPFYSKRDGDILKHEVEAIGISGSVLRQVDKQ